MERFAPVFVRKISFFQQFFNKMLKFAQKRHPFFLFFGDFFLYFRVLGPAQ